MKVLSSIILISLVILSNSVAQSTNNISADNATFLGNYPFGPCRAVAVSSDGSEVYLGNGGFLRVIDLGGVNVQVRSFNTPGVIHDIEVSRDEVSGDVVQFVYLANGVEGFSVVDLFSGEVFNHFTEAPVTNIHIDGATAYLANNWGGVIRVLNIDNPSDMIFEPIEIDGVTEDITFADDKLFMANRDHGIATLNMTEGTTPEFFPVEGEPASIMLIDQNTSQAELRLGLTTLPIWDDDGNVSMNGSVQIFNIQDLTSPLFKFGDEKDSYTPYNMTVDPDNIYVAEGGYGLGIYDVDGNHQFSIESFSELWDVAVSGSHAVVADEHGGLGIKNLDNLNANWFDDQVNFPSAGIDVAAAGNFVFVADAEGILVLDVSDPENPVRINYIKLDVYVNNMVVAHGRLYYCYWGGVAFMDLANFEPKPLIELESEIYNLAVEDNFLFFAADDGLGIKDVNEPGFPEILLPIKYVKDVEVDLPYIYAVHYSGDGTIPYFTMLEIVGTETNITWSAQINNANSLSVQGEYAYLDDFNAEQEKVLRIYEIDFHNDPHLIPISTLDSDRLGWINSVHVSQNRVYIATDDEGLNIADVHDPWRPRIAGNIDTPGEAYAVDVSNNKVYVADNSMGVAIVRDDGVMPVEFVCDMTNEIEKGNFEPGSNLLTVSGNFNGWSDVVLFSSDDDPNIYSRLLFLGLESSDTLYYNFAYVNSDGNYVPDNEFGYHVITQEEISNNFAEIRSTFEMLTFVTVLAPNGGESWEAGTSQMLSWNSINVNNVILEYSTNDGSDWILIDDALPINSGVFSTNWTVPDTPSDQCLLKVTNLDERSIFDVSDNTFSITSLPEPIIRVVSPNGGEKFVTGEVHQIEWTAQNISNVIIEYNTTSSEDTWEMISNTVPASSNSMNWTIPDVESDNCRIMVSSADDMSIFDRSDDTFTIFKYPESITLSRGISFGSVEQTSSYRMVGLPGGDFSLHITDFISGSYGDDWRMFRDNGRETDYLVEYSGSGGDFGFAPGEGYWLVSRSDVNIQITVSNIGLEEDYSYPIPLKNGWNIISNPFINAVSWKAVKDLNDLNPGDELHRYNGSFSLSSFLQPYSGYYYYNNGNRSTLDIPYQIASSGVLAKSVSENLLEIILYGEGEEKSRIGVGFNPEASSTFDGFDVLKPRSDFEDASISIYNKDLEIPHKYLYTEYRPEIGDGQIYDVAIRLVEGGQTSLIVEGLDMLHHQEIVLHDLRLNKFYDLKSSSQIKYSSLHENNNLNLLIGDADFIKGVKENFIPAEFELYQNYPNPFNPRTIIRFALADAGNVNLSVYNSLGELMIVLLDDRYYDMGYQEVEFNAADLSSGVYFYKIQSGSYSAVKKLVLMK